MRVVSESLFDLDQHNGGNWTRVEDDWWVCEDDECGLYFDGSHWWLYPFDMMGENPERIGPFRYNLVAKQYWCDKLRKA